VSLPSGVSLTGAVQPPAAMFTVPEAVAWSRIGRTSLYAHIKSGRLDARKHGRRTLISAASLAALLGSLPPAHRSAA